MSATCHPDQRRAKLERVLGYLLQDFVSRSDRTTRDFAAQRDMSLNDMRALLYTASACGRGETVHPGDLCDELALSGAAVTYLLDRSNHRGHLHRQPDPTDRRKAMITLAEAGVRVVREFASLLHRRRRARLVDLPDADLEAATRVIRALIAAARDVDAVPAGNGHTTAARTRR